MHVRAPTLEDLLAPAQMIAWIRREAALADRAERDYSVIVFEVQDPASDPRPASQLVLRARHEMLPGDDIGWLGAGRVALSLPLSDPQAALTKAARILASGPQPSRTVVYVQTAQPQSADGAALTVRPLAELLHDPLPRWKRGVDVFGACLALLLTMPILLVAALMVRLSSPGPVILRQRRAGVHGMPFVIYKFRTMVDGAERMKAALLAFNERSGPIFKMKNDPRITRIGRILRATSIDELPQLWNVLRGEMSLVGPRPPTLDEVPAYRAWHRRRLSVCPGITGLWQLAGRGGVDFDDMVRLDLRYIARRSPFGDLHLLGATIPAVLSRRGAS